MDFQDIIRQLVERIEKMKDSVLTEEATKTAFIMPFINALGYDVFNPTEVVPEFICDIGTKKGEKIDYAIMQDGKPVILIECKHCLQDLNLHDNQLLRYFTVSPAKFGVLTNGIIYRFYTDLEKENVMDEKPFLEVNLLELRDTQIEELRKFHKSYFDVGNIMNTASELKYTNELKRLIASELNNPTPEFVKFFARQVYSGQMKERAMEQFTGLMKRAASQWKNDLINERLKAALNNEVQVSAPATDASEPEPEQSEDGIVTTAEELQGFYIVKSILAQKVSLNRVVGRDTKSYFGILLDDNNRKPLCRLWFNRSNKYVGTFDAEKNETRHLINSLDEIYTLAEPICAAVDYYEGTTNGGE
ncbi:type I restriction endonuclease [uncultured Rikenella sp.]|uniref:type I restriction endonuclease n=1 Tax=uncultured Rikenella sp. TaxID=368003 RepID=UPI00261F26B5|nr:type I restriction endonuclease [uncultured Rikenella sp.]